MGISPSELKDTTPYEFNLLREGYIKRVEQQTSVASQQTWLLHSAIYGAVGIQTPDYEQWKGGEAATKAEPDESPSNIPGGRAKKLKSARKISAKKKAEYEAAMNAIP